MSALSYSAPNPRRHASCPCLTLLSSGRGCFMGNAVSPIGEHTQRPWFLWTMKHSLRTGLPPFACQTAGHAYTRIIPTNPSAGLYVEYWGSAKPARPLASSALTSRYVMVMITTAREGCQSGSVPILYLNTFIGTGGWGGGGIKNDNSQVRCLSGMLAYL